MIDRKQIVRTQSALALLPDAAFRRGASGAVPEGLRQRMAASMCPGAGGAGGAGGKG